MRIISDLARYLAVLLQPIKNLVAECTNYFQGNLIPLLRLNKSISFDSGFTVSHDTRLYCHSEGKIKLGSNVELIGTTIRVAANAVLEVGDNSNVNYSEIVVEKGGSVSIGSNNVFNNANLTVMGQGHCRFDTGCFFRSQFSLFIEGGIAEFGSWSYGSGTYQVCFGGHFKIGEHTGISSGVQIRCHESVVIGNYCLIAHDCLIFDTNTHSTSWQHRRSRIEAGYEQRRGAFEIERPGTSPIEIGDDVWIGMRSIITKGSKIGNRVIIGMGTVVVGLVPNDCTFVSQKARVVLRRENTGNRTKGKHQRVSSYENR